MPRDKRRRVVPSDQMTALGEAVGINLERVEALALPAAIKQRVLHLAEVSGLTPAELISVAVERLVQK